MHKTHQHHLITHAEQRDTNSTNAWLAQAGFNIATFSSTHVKLLQAQQAANCLLDMHTKLLSNEQTTMLKQFLKNMAHKNTRNKLTPKHAYPVLNLNNKINRKLFELNKQL